MRFSFVLNKNYYLDILIALDSKIKNGFFSRILAEYQQSFGQCSIAVGAKAIVDKCLFFLSKILMTRASGSIERHLSMQFVSSWQAEIVCQGS